MTGGATRLASASSLLPKPGCRSKLSANERTNSERLGVQLIQNAQALEGQVDVEGVYLTAVTDDDRSRAARRENAQALRSLVRLLGHDVSRGVSRQLLAHSPDQGVYGPGVAVDEAAPDGVGGVGGNGLWRLFFEVNAGEFGRLRDESIQGHVEPRKDGPAPVGSLRVHRADGGGRPEVHDDRRVTIVAARRHGVDDPVRPDRPRIVVTVLEAGLHARVHLIE